MSNQTTPGISTQNPSSNINGLAGLLSAVLGQTSSIQSADNGLDSKAHNLMAAALVIVALLGTQIKGKQGDLHYWTIAAMAILVVVVALILYLTRSQKYAGTVVDLSTHQDYFLKDDELLLAQLIEDANSANDKNSAKIELKKSQFRHAVEIFIFGFIIALISLFVA